MAEKYINDASMIDTVDSEAENSASENLRRCGMVRGEVLFEASSAPLEGARGDGACAYELAQGVNGGQERGVL